MLEQIIEVYCTADELLKALNIQDDVQCRMSTAEVMTFSVLSAMFYCGDYKKTRLMALYHNYFPNILSISRLVRRIHQIPENVWHLFFQAMQVFLRSGSGNNFIVDSFPVKAYENHKSFRARIFSGKEFHGYSASRKQYFFGIKVHMIITEDGVPVEFSFTPGSYADCKSLENMPINLPEGSLLLGDRAYTNYQFEDFLGEVEGIKLIAKRRKNSKRPHSPEDERLLSSKRNYIETVFSSIIRKMPRSISARTEKGFCLKVFFFILAYTVNLLFPLS